MKKGKPVNGEIINKKRLQDPRKAAIKCKQIIICIHFVVIMRAERKYIENAFKAGMTTLGFSDHAPYTFPDGYSSGFRMDFSDLVDYVGTLTGLREEYKSDIRILIGFETDSVFKIKRSKR